MRVLLDVGLTETIDASHVGVIALPDIDGCGRVAQTGAESPDEELKKAESDSEVVSGGLPRPVTGVGVEAVCDLVRPLPTHPPGLGVIASSLRASPLK